MLKRGYFINMDERDVLTKKNCAINEPRAIGFLLVIICEKLVKIKLFLCLQK